MQKGMISEAEAVLTYLKTIAPSSSMLAIEISFALKKNDWQSAWNAAVRLRKDATAVQDERYKATVADALVLAFPSGQEIGGLNLPEASELGSDCQRAALRVGRTVGTSSGTAPTDPTRFVVCRLENSRERHDRLLHRRSQKGGDPLCANCRLTA